MVISIAIILILFLVILYLYSRNRTEKNKTADFFSLYDILLHEYVAVTRLDLNNDTYEIVKVTKEVAELLQNVNNQATFQLQTVMKNVADDYYTDGILDFVDLSTLEHRLEHNKVISYDFQGKFNGWCRASFIWENKEKKMALYLVRIIENDKMIENQLRFKLEKDTLTGLLNEDYGITEIKKKLDNRTAGMFCLIEVDHFKDLNDTYGSIVGNQIIVQVANSLKECFKNTDVILRRGGARFAVFAVDVQDKEDGRFIMKLLESQINVISITDVKITISAGVDFNRTENHKTYEELLTNAETCLKTSRDIDGVSISYHE